MIRLLLALLFTAAAVYTIQKQIIDNAIRPGDCYRPHWGRGLLRIERKLAEGEYVAKNISLDRDATESERQMLTEGELETYYAKVPCLK
jgi:hypothetical protein